MAPLDDLELVYVTYHVDVGETPFMVGVDHQRRSVIVCIRGTTSTKVSRAEGWEELRDGQRYYSTAEQKDGGRCIGKLKC